MLNNKQISSKFDLLAKLMELHDDNPFKIKTYANAYLSLRKLEGNLAEMSKAELASIKGVGSTVADKIKELVETGEMKALEKFREMTPEGIQQMLAIKGLGPKKVKQIWKEMEIETIGELLYACNENRLVAYSGFGPKIQADIIEKLEYFQASQGKFLYAHVHKQAEKCLELIKTKQTSTKIEICGDVRRMMPEVKGIELLSDAALVDIFPEIESMEYIDDQWYFMAIPIFIYVTESARFDQELFRLNSSESFYAAFSNEELSAGDDQLIFKNKGLPFIPAEFREHTDTLSKNESYIQNLIVVEDIQGIVHNHSTYSDGLHTLKEMADYVRDSGFKYFVISDHSKSAGYASGLNEESVLMQWNEIENLNNQYKDGFKIYKGIESDILTDGSLDYSDDILAGFDLVIASVHSGLNMDEEKATRRLITAIENPYTRILGHPTGRLLLARRGYPVDYKKVIDACAANNVVIELNANPQRLDLDWTWIPYALDKHVKVAINPDAHSKESIHYIKYGVAAARKGGLTKDMCLNTMNKEAFDQWLSRK
ncbi:MAG TPA: helix-hairpin-helix domain-containing protein [Saprospiraceae bacterium]|jgi:DNA polymerase (family 10)|nr:helix-hairpin-helix domain-containing protein [Saprospiraceae bacterium]HMT70727.1 helix-hairpin-helix domain-containing protein [Saprospiraceae bacterium]